MRYYKVIENGQVIAIGTGDGAGIDITAEEYDEIMSSIKESVSSDRS